MFLIAFFLSALNIIKYEKHNKLGKGIDGGGRAVVVTNVGANSINQLS